MHPRVPRHRTPRPAIPARSACASPDLAAPPPISPQERTYLRFYGLLAERFCLIDRAYQACSTSS